MGLLALLSLGLAFAGAPSVLPGSPALQFTLPAVNEAVAMELVNKPTVALSDFAGFDPAYPHRAVVVWFCTRAAGGDSLVALEALTKHYRGKDVAVVAVLADGGEMGPLADWLGGLGLTYPVLRDHHRIVAGRYGVTDFPVAYVVDGGGDVFAVGNPKGAEVEAELMTAVNALLESAPQP